MFANPENNIEKFGIEPGMKVADLGSGSGHYSIAASKAVGPLGKVYAVDVMKDLLLKVKKEAQDKHIANIDIVHGDIEKLGGTKLREQSVDRVILSNILFQLEDRTNIATEVKRILKPKGRVLVIDWTASFGMMGPHPEHVVTKRQAIELFEKAGFALEREFTAGAHHYGVVFMIK